MRRVLAATAVAAALTGCLGILDPDSGDDIEYLVERFAVEFDEVDWAPFPIAYLAVQMALVNAGSDSVL